MNDEIHVKVFSWGPNRPLTMQWHDPISGKRKTETTGTFDWAEAQRIAGDKEAKLRAGVVVPAKMTWTSFRKRYREEKLAGMKKGSRVAYEVSLNHVSRVLDPSHLSKMTTAAITTFVARLRREGMIPTTIARHLRGVKVALRWAHRQGYLAVVPQFDMPKDTGKMKGRPPTGEEFDRILEAVPKIRENDPAPWERLLWGLWLSGLRISEAIALDWQDGPFQVDLHGKHPTFRIQGEGQKSGKAETLPLTPDFAQWILDATPEALRVGRVFPLPDYRKGRQGRQTGVREASKVLADIGEKAGVVVDRSTRQVRDDKGKVSEVEVVKYASAHDLRRSFGTRWSQRVKPPVLQRLMRHSHIGTTMQYYVSIDTDEMAADLWREYAPQESFNKSVNNRQKRKQPKTT